MKIVRTIFDDVKVIEPFRHADDRGEFVKPFHVGQLSELGIELDVKEEFFSTSTKNVVRGLHFQMPPHAHQKLVYCIEGSVMDVVLDLRKDSPHYGKSQGVELSELNRLMIHIPIGFAHGFMSLTDRSCLVYKTDCVYEPDSDAGILWSSIAYDWGIKVPLLSDRDKTFQGLADFTTPFV